MNIDNAHMAITKEEVKKIARLSRLKLSDDEVLKHQQEIDKILTWIDQLQELNVDGIEPLTSSDGDSLRTHPDVVADGNIRDEVLSNAPNAKYGYFAVPKVVE